MSLYKDRKGTPAISVYLISDESPQMSQMSCIWCKRTIADVKGHVDALISTPMPTTDFDVAINIRCKLCRQDYRLLVGSS
jgi:hypothetical protein